MSENNLQLVLHLYLVNFHTDSASNHSSASLVSTVEKLPSCVISVNSIINLSNTRDQFKLGSQEIQGMCILD